MISVGIISAPRNPYYLGNSLDTYFEEWNIKPHVFHEPNCPKYLNMEKVTQHTNQTTLGCVFNWINAAEYLLKETKTPYVMICEDDISWMAGARAKVEQCLKDVQKQVGLVSPYCALMNAPINERRKPVNGWAEMKYRSSGMCGALCLIFPRDVLGNLMKAKDAFINHTYGDDSARSRRIFSGPIFLDYAIGHMVRRVLNLKLITHSPTLIQHLGDVSTFPQNNNKPIGMSRQANI